MTNFEKWVIETGYTTPLTKTQIVCFNTKCEDCPIYKHFRICESNETIIEEWLNNEEE